jgi:hypothetical protein
MFEQLGASEEFKEAAEQLQKHCNHPSQDSARARGECTVDNEFMRLLRSPRRHLHTLVQRALMHLEDAEDVIKATNGEVPEYSAYVEAAFSHYRASSFRYRQGIHNSRIELNPSSAIWDGRGFSKSAASVLGIVAPNYANLIGFGRSGDVPSELSTGRSRETSITAGWRPIVVRTAEQISLNSTVELSRYRDLTTTEGRKWDVAWGGSVGTHAWTIPFFSYTEVGLLRSHHILSQESKPVDGPFSVYHVTGRMLGDKVQLSARWADGRAWSASLGLSDLNGLLYWWLR